MNIVDLYMRNLRKEDVINFALRNDIHLSDEEAIFTYDFIKNNYKDVMRNKDAYDFNDYKEKFSEENFKKIEILIKKYISYL